MKRQTVYHNFKGLSELIPAVSRFHGWQKKLDQHMVFLHWHKIVDKEIADHASPVKIVKNVLWLGVENSAWQQQMQYQKTYLLTVINRVLKKTFIDDIRFCLLPDTLKPAKVKDKPPCKPPSSEAITAFSQMAATIKDEKSRQALMDFWYASKMNHPDS
jgi:hypothetical protein